MKRKRSNPTTPERRSTRFKTGPSAAPSGRRTRTSARAAEGSSLAPKLSMVSDGDSAVSSTPGARTTRQGKDSMSVEGGVDAGSGISNRRSARVSAQPTPAKAQIIGQATSESESEVSNDKRRIGGRRKAQTSVHDGVDAGSITGTRRTTRASAQRTPAKAQINELATSGSDSQPRRNKRQHTSRRSLRTLLKAPASKAANTDADADSADSESEPPSRNRRTPAVLHSSSDSDSEPPSNNRRVQTRLNRQVSSPPARTPTRRAAARARFGVRTRRVASVDEQEDDHVTEKSRRFKFRAPRADIAQLFDIKATTAKDLGASSADDEYEGSFIDDDDDEDSAVISDGEDQDATDNGEEEDGEDIDGGDDMILDDFVVGDDEIECEADMLEEDDSAPHNSAADHPATDNGRKLRSQRGGAGKLAKGKKNDQHDTPLEEHAGKGRALRALDNKSGTQRQSVSATAEAPLQKTSSAAGGLGYSAFRAADKDNGQPPAEKKRGRPKKKKRGRPVEWRKAEHGPAAAQTQAVGSVDDEETGDALRRLLSKNVGRPSEAGQDLSAANTSAPLPPTDVNCAKEMAHIPSAAQTPLFIQLPHSNNRTGNDGEEKVVSLMDAMELDDALPTSMLANDTLTAESSPRPTAPEISSLRENHVRPTPPNHHPAYTTSINPRAHAIPPSTSHQETKRLPTSNRYAMRTRDVGLPFTIALANTHPLNHPQTVSNRPLYTPDSRLGTDVWVTETLERRLQRDGYLDDEAVGFFGMVEGGGALEGEGEDAGGVEARIGAPAWSVAQSEYERCL